jgi:hypothetical protein
LSKNTFDLQFRLLFKFILDVTYPDAKVFELKQNVRWFMASLSLLCGELAKACFL